MAAAGALIQRERAANSRAEQYSVLLDNGATIAIVSEHHDIQTGDCVAVEQGRHANIRRVSPVMCRDVTNASHPHHADLHAANLAEASECERIKDEILTATTQAQVDLAYQKMRALCEHSSGRSRRRYGRPHHGQPGPSESLRACSRRARVSASADS